MVNQGIPPVFKAVVSTLSGSDRNGDCSEARVLPMTAEGVVTRPYALHWSLRGAMSDLKVGDEVVCFRFDDGTGLVICRADGEWSGVVPGDVALTGSLLGSRGAEFAEDVHAGSVSLSQHKHTCPDGTTSAPS